MVNDPIDAINYYNKSIDILRKNEDFLWNAACLEGICAAYYIKYIKMIPQDYNIFAYETYNKMKIAVMLLEKSKFIHHEIESRFKLIHALFISRLD